MTINVDELKREGWYVDTIKMQEEEFPELSNTKEAIAELMDWDMKSFGASVIADCLDKKSGSLNGPLVLQLTSWRNISCPKIPEHDENDGACKLLLSDGFSSVPGVQLDGKLPISGRTPYGSKVLLTGQLAYECGHLILNNSNCKLLGGHVEKLVERWKMAKLGAIVVKKVEKDASYTKFEPLSNAKVEALSKAVKNIDIKAEEAPSNDRPPRSNAQRDVKPENNREKTTKKLKPEKSSGRQETQRADKPNEAPGSSRRQRPARTEPPAGRENGDDRRNRNASEAQPQPLGRIQPSRPANRHSAVNDQGGRRTGPDDRQSSSRRFDGANDGRGGRRPANMDRNNSQPRNTGSGRNGESQRGDPMPRFGQPRGQPSGQFGQHFVRPTPPPFSSGCGPSYQMPMGQAGQAPMPLASNFNAPPPPLLFVGPPPGFGNPPPSVPHQSSFGGTGPPRRGGVGRVFHRRNHPN